MVSISDVKSKLSGLSKSQLIGIAAGTAVIGTGAALGVATYRKSRKKNSKRKSRNRSARVQRRNSHQKRKRYTPYTAGKRKDTSRRRIRHTKTGQPYVILANGRARFISKKSAKMSRKRSGGRY